MFNSLKGKGLTIFVGHPSDTSAADCYINSPEEVKTFLEHLYQQKNVGCNELFTEGKRTIVNDLN